MPEPMSKPATEDAAVFQPGDARPVFAGDWAKASGKERQAHMTLIAKWKAAQEPSAPGKGQSAAPAAQSRMVEPGEGQARHGAPRAAAADADADDLRALQHIIDAAPILSDRTRAIEAKQRILQRQQAEERSDEHGPLVALRDALSALPEGERVDALGGLLGIAPLREAK